MGELLAKVGWATSARVVSAGGSALLLWLMATAWAPEQLADYAIVLSYLAILQTLPLLGLGFAVTRDVAADPNRAAAYLRAALAIGLAASIGLFLALGFGGEALYGDRLRTAFWAAGVSLLATAFVSVFESQMMGAGRLGLVALMNAAENIARLAGFMAIADAQGGVVDFLLLMSLIRIGVVLGYAAMPSVRAGLRAAGPAPSRQVAAYLRQAPSFLGAVLAGALISRLDVLCLSALVSKADLGIYALAARIYEMAMMVPVTFTIAFFPILARMHGANPSEFRFFARCVLGIVATSAMIAAIVAVLATEPLMEILFAPPYDQAVPSVRILLIAAAMAGISQVLASIIVVCHQQGADLLVQIAALLVLPAVLVFAVSRIGLHGAAIAVLVSVLTQVVGRYLICRRHIGAAARLAGRPSAITGGE